ncbi:ribosomal s21 [Trichoderma arundinaceum]|uniref:Ribosomal s21 n=1 Tax=Trichoderma arundinaceum TaxID=490622 RepID=A0A395NM76_TRIAR|nr:ribosomal s21 [Trichoderma arundinaceum]
MMLSRIAAPAQARAFSTSLAMRFNASRPVFDDRKNPLVGNFAPPAPAAKPAAAHKAQPEPITKTEEPSVASSRKADFTPPPPPPPPAESASPEQPSSAQKSSSSFPYTAADSSTPFNFDIAEIVAARSAAYGQSLNVFDPLLRPKVRTEAVSGRTVFIKDRLSPTSAPTPAVAIRVLEKMCRDQKVRNKYHSQKFHERKGLKKKRLRSQRWRARFKTGFKAAVSKVMELKKQGW